MAIQSERHVTIDFNVPAEMRDVVVLRANSYRPAGDERWPVLLTRTPYGKDFPNASGVLDPVLAARRGYVVIVQDARGRFASAGEWDPMRNEALDGVDTIAWAAELPYSNGEVGMFGASYLGFTQWSAAVHRPAALKVMIPYVTWNDPFNGQLFRGGAFELGIAASWQLFVGANVVMRRHALDTDPRQLGADMFMWAREVDTLGTQGYKSLPLKDFAPLQRNSIGPAFFEAVEHPMDREYMEPITLRGKQELVTIPTFHIGGWYDIFLQDTLENFRVMREQSGTPQARQTKLLVGPWSHTSYANPIGEINFGITSTASLLNLQGDTMSMQLRWFDHFLKGLDTGMPGEAPIKLFVMGANIWRDEQEWPLARAVETRYYLHSEGQANSLHGDGRLSTSAPETEAADYYDYDPANPVLTRGGSLLMTPEFPAGAFDQCATEERTDVLVYTTPALEQDIEVTGPISVHLWATSSAPDTDFVARLVDVYPNGYAQNLTDGIIRARHRDFNAGAAATLIEAGKAYEFVLDLWSTSNVFKRGHRIRLDVTSSNFPRWDRNPNTGHAFGADAELAVAHQTILHDAEHPSYVLLPVIPA